MTSCKKKFFGFGAILLAVFAITTSSDAQQKLTYSGAWVQEMADGLEAIYGLQEDAGERLKKIEKSFQDQSAALGGNPSCKRVYCKALAALIGDFARSDAAIRATQLLGHISVQQQGRLGDNTEKIAREIRRGGRTGERKLFWQNFALAAGELSLHIVAAMATGDVTTLPEAVIGSVSNFLISKGTGYPAKIGEWTEQGADAAGGGELTKTFAGTLSSQLTRFGGVSVSGDKMIFKPAFAVQGIAKTRGPEKLKELRRLKAIRALPNVVDASLQAIMRTVTAPSLNRTKKDLARNRKELQETMAAYRNFLVTVTYQKLYNKEYTYLRNEFRKLKDRADKLRQQCAEQVRTRACGDTLSAAIDKAESDRSKAVGGANAKRKAATGRLTAARTRWGDMMRRVDETHRKLGKARARLAETKNLQKNRDRIRDLAFKATDADIRDKYRKQWDDLQTREPVAQQSAAVARLTRERADLWQGDNRPEDPDRGAVRNHPGHISG